MWKWRRDSALVGEAEANIYDNFNTDRPSDSLLPHVRSDFVKYFTEGKNGIGQLEGDYRFRLAPDVYAIARAGYLESMFAGGGGEVLWRRKGSAGPLAATFTKSGSAISTGCSACRAIMF